MYQAQQRVAGDFNEMEMVILPIVTPKGCA